MLALFGLFAEIERGLISERTKEGLAAARAKGKILCCPKGTRRKSRLDGFVTYCRVGIAHQLLLLLFARKEVTGALGINRLSQMLKRMDVGRSPQIDIAVFGDAPDLLKRLGHHPS